MSAAQGDFVWVQMRDWLEFLSSWLFCLFFVWRNAHNF